MCRVCVPDVSRLAFPMCRDIVPDVSTLQIRGAGLNHFLPNGGGEGSKSCAVAPGAARAAGAAGRTRHFGNARPCPVGLRRRFRRVRQAPGRRRKVPAPRAGWVARRACEGFGQGAMTSADPGSTRPAEGSDAALASLRGSARQGVRGAVDGRTLRDLRRGGRQAKESLRSLGSGKRLTEAARDCAGDRRTDEAGAPIARPFVRA